MVRTSARMSSIKIFSTAESSEEKLKRRLRKNDRVALQDACAEVTSNERRESSDSQQDGALNRRKDNRKVLINVERQHW